jgi:hypothetical protein
MSDGKNRRATCRALQLEREKSGCIRLSRLTWAVNHKRSNMEIKNLKKRPQRA